MTSYVDPEIFNFIKHWNSNDRKYIAACCSNIFKMYYFIEQKEKIQIALAMILSYYKRKGCMLLANEKLAGAIKVEISRINSKNRLVVWDKKLSEEDENYTTKMKNLITSTANTEIIDNSAASEIEEELIYMDLVKLLGKRRADTVMRKMNGESLNKQEHAVINRAKGKIGEYLKV